MNFVNRGCFQGSAPTEGHHMDTSDDNDNLNKNCGLQSDRAINVELTPTSYKNDVSGRIEPLHEIIQVDDAELNEEQKEVEKGSRSLNTISSIEDDELMILEKPDENQHCSSDNEVEQMLSIPIRLKKTPNGYEGQTIDLKSVLLTPDDWLGDVITDQIQQQFVKVLENMQLVQFHEIISSDQAQ